jgi:hypothetical protein
MRILPAVMIERKIRKKICQVEKVLGGDIASRANRRPPSRRLYLREGYWTKNEWSIGFIAATISAAAIPSLFRWRIVCCGGVLDQDPRVIGLSTIDQICDQYRTDAPPIT